MGLFKIFRKKEPEKIMEIGQVGNNKNQKLVEKNDKLFIQDKSFLGKKEVPINPIQKEKIEEQK